MSIKKKIAMLKRWTMIALGKSATAVKQNEGKYYSKDEIKGYYNDMSGKLGSGTMTDEYGIPVSEITGGEYVHFPIAIFQYGLALYDKYLEEGVLAPEFRTIADWALLMQKDDGSWDAFGPMKSKKYTVSSMCQGEGASMLFRAADVYRDKIYEKAAFQAVDYMLTPTEQGGTSMIEGEKLYLEEYPQTPRRSVLNGWIYSIYGLYDAHLLNPDKYKGALEQTIKTLKTDLDFYDNGYWSMYDQNGKIASPAYHNSHIALLNVLYELTGEKKFKDTENKYRTYQKSKINKMRAVITKIVQKLSEESDVITIK